MIIVGNCKFIQESSAVTSADWEDEGLSDVQNWDMVLTIIA